MPAPITRSDDAIEYQTKTDRFIPWSPWNTALSDGNLT